MVVYRIRKLFSVIAVIILIVFVFNMCFKEQETTPKFLFNTSRSEMKNTTPVFYLVNTSSCKITDLSSQNSQVELRHIPRQKCPKAVFKVLNNTLKLDLNGTGRKNCCLRKLMRNEQTKKHFNQNADWLVKTSKTCLPIPSEGVQLNSSFGQIECDERMGQSKGKNTKHVDYVVTVLSPEAHSKETANKAIFWKKILHKTPALTNSNISKQDSLSSVPPSILILGINGISRSHSMRVLPQTRKFLFQNDFIEMEGFTKIGSNTFSNMMATLTGLPKNHECYKQPKNMPLDNCPFIWKDFSRKNYITSVVEDSPGIAMFNYNKIGFINQPMDYSIRTPFVALQNRVRVARNLALNTQCMSGLTLFDNLFKYLEDFLNQVAGKYPYFLLTWFKTLKASYFHSIQNEDINFTRFLSNVIKNPQYKSNNTVIIVLSSHGQALRGSETGSYLSSQEESLPMNFIRLPPSLKKIRPNWYKNLKSNSKLLTSPYDVHGTLKDILNSSSSTIIKSQEKTSLKKYSSLFDKIPQDRSCPSSLIPESICRCDTSPSLFNTSTLAQKLGQVIVSTINKNLEPVMGRRLCVRLHFGHLVYGRQVDHGLYFNGNNTLIKFVDYLIAIEVSPSFARFETVIRDASDGSLKIVSPIKRVNPIKIHSYCVARHRQFIPFCFCHEIHLQQRIQDSKNYMKWSSKND